MGNDMEFEGERPPMNVLPHPSGIRVRLTKLRKCSYKTSSQSGTKLDFDLQPPDAFSLGCFEQRFVEVSYSGY